MGSHNPVCSHLGSPFPTTYTHTIVQCTHIESVRKKCVGSTLCFYSGVLLELCQSGGLIESGLLFAQIQYVVLS